MTRFGSKQGAWRSAGPALGHRRGIGAAETWRWAAGDLGARRMFGRRRSRCAAGDRRRGRRGAAAPVGSRQLVLRLGFAGRSPGPPQRRMAGTLDATRADPTLLGGGARRPRRRSPAAAATSARPNIRRARDRPRPNATFPARRYRADAKGRGRERQRACFERTAYESLEARGSPGGSSPPARARNHLRPARPRRPPRSRQPRRRCHRAARENEGPAHLRIVMRRSCTSAIGVRTGRRLGERGDLQRRRGQRRPRCPRGHRRAPPDATPDRRTAQVAPLEQPDDVAGPASRRRRTRWR